ncbi:sortase-associated OmpA-like protein PdsO [Alteromonas halophila]|uniref:OmpA-like domain-containing protein n=1 Tax=Alteromonas halophila TaxID=516698 RepID=A0A918JIN1_9ALTE|nr:sortase-associated OmpA-like protein PdsO [Alteromonas halophila]GGW83087.1 hypothetical protein GCM10007391_15440 [Alteromonas halophila]
MIKSAATLAIIITLAAPVHAQDNEDDKSVFIGMGSGALLGTLVAGPAGGVIAGMFGAMIANDKVTDEKLEMAQAALQSSEDELFAMRDALHQMKEQARVTRVAYQEEPKERVLAIESSIQFKTASVNIESNYNQQLDLIADALTRHNQLQVRLTGHADNRGDEKFNEALSMQRALNVKRYLVEKGVSPKQILTVAVGERNSDGASYEETFFDRKVVLEVSGSGEVMTAKR